MHETIQEFTCSEKQKEELRKIASSTSAGIWSIKRAKIILGVLEGKSIERLVLDVRVVPESIIKCLKRFPEEGMKFFDSPNRRPTLRETTVERMLDLLDHPPPPRSKRWNDVKVHYIGRDFSAREIKKIRDLIEFKPDCPRMKITHEICRMFGLYQSNGEFKKTGTLIALKRMDMDNIVALPPVPKKTKRNEAKKKQNLSILTVPEPEKTIFLNGHDLELIQFMPVTRRQDLDLWNGILKRYHYIPGHTLWGAQMKYLVYGGRCPKAGEGMMRGNENMPLKKRAGQGNAAALKKRNRNGYRGEHLLAVLGFAACSWRVASRDKFIGWTEEQRWKNLNLVVSNARFLILPWIKSPNLASRILAGISKQLPIDWEARYNYRPVLIETFVQLPNFQGTCYRAANWIEVGTTKGYGIGREQKARSTTKALFLYPLKRNFRKILCNV